MNNRALELTEMAVSRNELSKLLLGEGEYSYISKFSPAIGTDITSILPYGIYKFQKINQSCQFSSDLYEALTSLTARYEGLEPVASFILVESSGRLEGKSPLSFSLVELASLLQGSIEAFRSRLEKDFTGYGFGWENGLYGELLNISRNTVEVGGPSFVPEKPWLWK